MSNDIRTLIPGQNSPAAGNAAFFIDLFRPYLQKYLFRQDAQDAAAPFLSGWQTAERPLTPAMIERAIRGDKLYGFFLAFCTSSFGLDIDDHTGKGAGYLLSVYNSVCSRLQARASVLVHSPRGLHPFYLLQHPVPEVLLIRRVRETLDGTPVEIKPTSQLGLRIPTEKDLIDPESLRPLQGSFAEIVQAATRYHPVELFADGLSARLFVGTLLERKAAAIRTKTWDAVARVEAEYASIKQGETNAALCELIPVYRSAGLSAEAAAAEFTGLLDPGYTGELRTPRRLLQRVRSFYRNLPETRFTAIPVGRQPELFTSQLADCIAALYLGPEATSRQRGALTQKRRTIRKAVLALESWKGYINEVKADKRFFEMWNYLYPYFGKNTGEGYYPLSRNILRQILEHYERYLLPHLIAVGYLTRSPYRYSSVYGICYYYTIDGDRFATQIAAMTPKPTVLTKAEQRAEAIRAYKREHPDMSNRSIAKVFHIDEKMVRLAFK